MVVARTKVAIGTALAVAWEVVTDNSSALVTEDTATVEHTVATVVEDTGAAATEGISCTLINIIINL